MAGPGAQIFIDGFRGGRLPPKDQIQQMRFNTNSYSAEYHEAGMVRVEVITRPGMGDLAREHELRLPRRVAERHATRLPPVRGPEQQKRFMVNVQGPLAKGTTGLSIAMDGNMAYDARTIVARTPTGEVNDQMRRPVGRRQRQRPARARSEPHEQPARRVRAARGHAAATSASATSTCWTGRTAATTVTDLLRVRNTRTIGTKVFSELRFELTQSQTLFTSASDAPTIRVLDAFTPAAPGNRARATAGS